MIFEKRKKKSRITSIIHTSEKKEKSRITSILPKKKGKKSRVKFIVNGSLVGFNPNMYNNVNYGCTFKKM